MTGITAALERLGVPLIHPPHRNVRRGWIGVDCPYCSPGQGKYLMGFATVGRPRVYCWTCGKLDGPEALQRLAGISRADALAVWMALDGATAPDAGDLSSRGVLRPPGGITGLQAAHRQYLTRRGFDPEAIARIWGVQGIGPAPAMAWRLYIPVHDLTGRVRSWTTRAIGADVQPRYWSAPPDREDQPIKSMLYGGHLAGHAAVIVEGPTDAWAIGPGAVATLGVGYSPAQLALLTRYPVRVICFDSSVDAQRRADDLARDLCVYPGTTQVVCLETGADPAEADPAEIAAVRDLAGI